MKKYPPIKFVIIIILEFVCFAADILLPRGYSDWIFYFFPLLLLFGAKPFQVIGMVIFVSILSVTGWLLSQPSNVPLIASIISHVSGLLIFWILTAGYSLLFRAEISRQMVEASLEQSEVRLRLALQVAGIGTFDWNVRTGENTWSAELEAMYGLRKGEFGKSESAWEQLVYHEDRAAAIDLVNRSFEVGNPVSGEWRVVWPDGSIHWINGRFQGFKDSEGKPLRLLGLNIDITEQKRLIDEEKKTAALEAANAELKSFSYSLSHDLRAPLHTMKGFSNVLIEDYSKQIGPEGQKLLGRIVQSADKMNVLIDDMLMLGKIAEHDMSPRTTNLSAIARKILTDLQQTERQRKIDVTIAEGLLALVDERLITIALSNLLGNAWKYTSKTLNARIEFGSRIKDGQIEYYVNDNGCGFAMNHYEKLFAPFQRLHSETDYPGTGVGLNIVKRVIERHGGRIWAESEVGKGSTFYFTLQLAKPRHKQ